MRNDIGSEYGITGCTVECFEFDKDPFGVFYSVRVSPATPRLKHQEKVQIALVSAKVLERCELYKAQALVNATRTVAKWYESLSEKA